MTRPDDKPVGRKAMTVDEVMSIVIHPAFRIGFLDAQAGLPIDHDRIVQRIESETPRGALQRLRWFQFGTFDVASDLLTLRAGAPQTLHDKNQMRAALAQYRYEEGRKAFFEHGVRAKAWGHPDYPPVQIRKLCERLAEERKPQEEKAA